jgi:hypothetical protein
MVEIMLNNISSTLNPLSQVGADQWQQTTSPYQNPLLRYGGYNYRQYPGANTSNGLQIDDMRAREIFDRMYNPQPIAQALPAQTFGNGISYADSGMYAGLGGLGDGSSSGPGGGLNAGANGGPGSFGGGVSFGGNSSTGAAVGGALGGPVGSVLGGILGGLTVSGPIGTTTENPDGSMTVSLNDSPLGGGYTEAGPAAVGTDSVTGGGASGDGSSSGGNSTGGSSAGGEGTGVGSVGNGGSGDGLGGPGWSEGGLVTADRLFGPDPDGPDDGAGYLQVGEWVLTPKQMESLGGEKMLQHLIDGKAKIVMV